MALVQCLVSTLLPKVIVITQNAWVQALGEWGPPGRPGTSQGILLLPHSLCTVNLLYSIISNINIPQLGMRPE